MKYAIFELNLFADAIAKANRVAPTKGSAYDLAAGIVINIDAAGECTVLATDTDVSLRQVITPTEVGGEEATWRVSSRLIHGIMSSLPVGGEDVRLQEHGTDLVLGSGKTRAKLRLVTGSYPIINKFSPAGMKTASDLSSRLSQVSWATLKRGSSALSGVHIDGEHLYGCDKNNVAMVPCKVPVDEPVTAPLTEMAAIIKNSGEVQIRATDRKLELMPDNHTQATCTLIREPYPDIKALIERSPFVNEVSLDTETLLGMLDRTEVIMKEERLPSTKIEIGDGYLKMELGSEAGLIRDEMSVKGGTSDPLRVRFNPDTLRKSVMASGRPRITLRYGPTWKNPFLLTDDQDYTAVMAAMADPV